MSGIKFRIEEMLRELESARTLTRSFIQNGDFVFGQMKSQLESLQYEKSPAGMSWEIPKGAPLRSITSSGEYEPGGKGIPVTAEFSFLWEVARIPPAKKRDPAKEMQLTGIASTVARIFEADETGSKGQEIAMWRIEIGDDGSPGCHFHVQILGEHDNGPFPKRLSVPRLPTCITSPMAALEFLLAELFQDQWKKHVSSETDDLKRWRSIQRERFRKLFEWQSSAVAKQNQASPWSSLKYAKPPADIFLP